MTSLYFVFFRDVIDFCFQVNLPANKISVYVKIEEPDIFLVENLDDKNSDALMMNTELQ